MKNEYDDPFNAEVRRMMHERLEELRVKYGDSDANDQKFIKKFLDGMKKG